MCIQCRHGTCIVCSTPKRTVAHLHPSTACISAHARTACTCHASAFNAMPVLCAHAMHVLHTGYHLAWMLSLARPHTRTMCPPPQQGRSRAPTYDRGMRRIVVGGAGRLRCYSLLAALSSWTSSSSSSKGGQESVHAYQQEPLLSNAS